MLLNKTFIFLSFCVIFSAVFCQEERNSKGKLIDFEKVEKAWEEGDDPELLEHEHDRIRKIQQSKMPRVDMNDGAAIQKAYKEDPFAFSGGGGGSMIFVDLWKTKKNDQKWTKYDLDKLATKWAGLIRSGANAATVYNVGENSLMVNVERAWMTKEILKFVAMQPEVESFNANSKTYHPADFEDDDEDDL
jgi:hypothetical protein